MTSSPASSSIASTGERSQALAVRRERRFASLGDHRARAIRRDDGSELTRLTSTYDSNPTWAPSAQRLAFTRRVGGDFHRAIYTIRRDGTGPKRLVRRGYNPSWSVRGTIAYETADGEIWATGPRGKRRWRLAGPGRCPHCGGAGGSNDPDWSPTGDKLVSGGALGWRPRGLTVGRRGLEEYEAHAASGGPSGASSPTPTNRHGLQTGAGSRTWASTTASTRCAHAEAPSDGSCGEPGVRPVRTANTRCSRHSILTGSLSRTSLVYRRFGIIAVDRCEHSHTGIRRLDGAVIQLGYVRQWRAPS